MPRTRTFAFSARTLGDLVGQCFQVFKFAEEEHAEVFGKEFGGERMHPSEKGKGKRWGTWKKGTYKLRP
jgi:hypothetical protein